MGVGGDLREDQRGVSLAGHPATPGRLPFPHPGFNADNGSEYINHKVAKKLEKLQAEFTKSRPWHSNDNSLAETKNGAIVRKQLGYEHIPQHFATEVNAFCQDYLNPYLNLHRPCLFPESVTDAKGKTANATHAT